MLEIKNLKVEIKGKILLKNFNLAVKEGEVHAIMGPNGAGKSSLSKVLAGHPKYQVVEGEIWYKGESLLDLPPEKRALSGLFVSFQYPIEISGLTNFEFLFTSFNLRKKVLKEEPISKAAFEKLLEEKLNLLQMRGEFIRRGVNEGFSGGEKKKNEILQMALFSPDLAVLDEIDSGMDIDGLKVISENINSLKTKKNSFLIITHYQRLLSYVKADYVHILKEGKLVKTGGPELAKEIEKKGYES
jgi:Fe-S cluster assembly ATP-binding protein